MPNVFRERLWDQLTLSGADGPVADDVTLRMNGALTGYLSTGYGLVGKADDNHLTTSVNNLKALSYVDHIQASIFWKNLQPTATTWDLSSVETLLNLVRGSGKKLIISLATTSSEGLPTWYFDDGTANKLTIASGAREHPVYWDRVYVTRLLALFRKLADSYCHEPLIEGWRGFGYSFTSFEPNLWDTDTNDTTLKAQVQAGVDVNGKGFIPQPYVSPAFNKPNHTRTSPYTLVVQQLLRAWHNMFPRHVQIVTIHFPQSGTNDYYLDTVMTETVEEMGQCAVNTGLNEQDKTTARTYFRALLAAGGGWVGWGGITGMGQGTADVVTANWWDAMREAVGGEFGEGSYQPESKISYLQINGDDLLPDGTRDPQAFWVQGRLFRRNMDGLR